jgi:phosphoribosyl 1,2-cyclic phosphodiesterase
MKLHVLKSESSGNGYIIYNDNECLILEAGVKLFEVKKVLDFDLSIIEGVLITHEHMDHCKYIEQYLDATLPCYTSKGTADNIKYKGGRRPRICEAGKQFMIGNFTVLAFDTIHDCYQPFGYLISHAETGTILFITDSFYSEFTFKNLNQIIMEVNYDPEILERNIEAGYLHPGVKNRIITSHLSINTAIDLLKANDLSQVNNIVLIHLSAGNSHAVNFQKTIEGVTGKTVTVADAGMEIVINKKPF